MAIAARSEPRQHAGQDLRPGVLFTAEPRGAALTGPRPGSCAAPPHVPQVIVLTGRLGTGPRRTGRRRSPARSSSDGIPNAMLHPTAGAVVAGVACAYHGPISALPRQRFPPRPERVSPLSAPRFHPLTSTKTRNEFFPHPTSHTGRSMIFFPHAPGYLWSRRIIRFRFVPSAGPISRH